MKTRVTKTPLEGLLVVNIDYFRDDRGFFLESWHKRDFAEAGIPCDFVQDSHSRSGYRVLRGLHYQDTRAPVDKLVRCTVGKILDVAVDIRMSSLTFAKWFSIEPQMIVNRIYVTLIAILVTVLVTLLIEWLVHVV